MTGLHLQDTKQRLFFEDDMTRSRFSLLTLFFLVFGLFFQIQNDANAQGASQSDFDADGNSEYTLIAIGNDKSLTWSAINSSTGAQSALGALGQSGDHIILAPWMGSGIPQIGIVSLDSNGKKVNWKILNDQGAEESREFGRKKDTIISGGDFNGDGIADAGLAVLKRKKVYWQVSYDLFSNPAGQHTAAKLYFGGAGDRVFFASPDGLRDWVGTLGEGPNKRPLMRLRNLTDGTVQTTTKLPRYTTKGSRPRPFPIKLADNTDVLGFAVVKGGNTRVDIRAISGERVSLVNMPGKGDLIVGNFTAAPGEEIAIKTSSGFTIFNHVTGETTTVATADGVAVDEININNLTASSGGGGGGGGSAPPPSGGNDSCTRTASWPGSHIYKTIGSSHFTDIRRNTSGVIIEPGGSGPFPSCISVVDTEGNKIGQMGLYAKGNGWAARYYAGIGCGGSTPYSGATLANKARSNTGSPFVYMNFGSVCYGPIDANKCIGSSQC